RVFGGAQFAAGLLDVEIRLSDGQQGVVAGRLQVRLACPDDLPLGQRGEDGVRDGENGGRAGADHEAVLARADDVAGDVLELAVVAEIVGPGVNCGEPQDVRPLKLRCGDIDSLRGELHVEGTDAGQLQRRGQVDRQRPAPGGRTRGAG